MYSVAIRVGDRPNGRSSTPRPAFRWREPCLPRRFARGLLGTREYSRGAAPPNGCNFVAIRLNPCATVVVAWGESGCEGERDGQDRSACLWQSHLRAAGVQLGGRHQASGLPGLRDRARSRLRQGRQAAVPVQQDRFRPADEGSRSPRAATRRRSRNSTGGTAGSRPPTAAEVHVHGHAGPRHRRQGSQAAEGRRRLGQGHDSARSMDHGIATYFNRAVVSAQSFTNAQERRRVPRKADGLARQRARRVGAGRVDRRRRVPTARSIT